MDKGSQKPDRDVEERREEPERYGPLAIERDRKADGRALIFYWRVRSDGEHGDG